MAINPEGIGTAGCRSQDNARLNKAGKKMMALFIGTNTTTANTSDTRSVT